MLDISKVTAGSQIAFIGDSFAFAGTYEVVTAESTYIHPSDCPAEEKGTYVIIEFMNDGTPMFFPLTMLTPNEWKIVS